MGLRVCLRVVFFRPNSLYICDTYSICIVQIIIIIYTNACLLYVTWEKVCVCVLCSNSNSFEKRREEKKRSHVSTCLWITRCSAFNPPIGFVLFFFPFGVSAVHIPAHSVCCRSGPIDNDNITNHHSTARRAFHPFIQTYKLSLVVT